MEVLLHTVQLVLKHVGSCIEMAMLVILSWHSRVSRSICQLFRLLLVIHRSTAKKRLTWQLDTPCSKHCSAGFVLVRGRPYSMQEMLSHSAKKQMISHYS